MTGLLAALYLGIHLAAQMVMERLGTRAKRISNRVGRAGAAEPAASPISVITPVYGADRFTMACLRSRLTQVTGGPVQQVFALQDPEDPAVALLKLLRLDNELETVTEPLPLRTNHSFWFNSAGTPVPA